MDSNNNVENDTNDNSVLTLTKDFTESSLNCQLATENSHGKISIVPKKLKEKHSSRKVSFKNDVIKDEIELNPSKDSLNKISEIDTFNPPKEDSLLIEIKNGVSSLSTSDLEDKSKISKFFSGGTSEMINLDNVNSDISNLNTIKDDIRKSLEKGNQNRLKANMMFKRSKYEDALIEFLKAVEELNTSIQINNQHDILNLTNINLIRLECLNNISVCYLVLKDYQKVLDYTSQVLSVNPKNFIALTYRAKAMISLNLLKEALDTIKVAQTVKQSKTLMAMYNDTEKKLNEEKINRLIGMKNENELYDNDLLADNDNNNPLNENAATNYNKDHNTKESIIKNNSNESNSIFKTIYKFIKIFSLSTIDIIKRHKFIFFILFLIWVIIFRRRLKNKLLQLLRIKFNL